MKLFSLIFIILFSSSLFASNCTEWVKESGYSCVFKSESADVWRRQCEQNFCWYNPKTRQGNRGPNCLKQRFCHPKVNPNNLTSKCTQWEKDSSITCRNPKTDRFETKWVRSCAQGVVESKCED